MQRTAASPDSIVPANAGTHTQRTAASPDSVVLANAGTHTAAFLEVLNQLEGANRDVDAPKSRGVARSRRVREGDKRRVPASARTTSRFPGQ
jgi:hypothetical protein